jgi:hypothetical protein
MSKTALQEHVTLEDVAGNFDVGHGHYEITNPVTISAPVMLL